MKMVKEVHFCSSANESYVYMQDLELNRSYRNDLEKAIEEMRNEMKLVDNMHKTYPINFPGPLITLYGADTLTISQKACVVMNPEIGRAHV